LAKSFKQEYFDPGRFNRHLFADCFDKINACRFSTNSRPGRVTKLPEAAFYVGMIRGKPGFRGGSSASKRNNEERDTGDSYCRGAPLLASGGTDGRPIIRKKTSVTGRHKKPVFLMDSEIKGWH
jgi:hypothetical protein